MFKSVFTKYILAFVMIIIVSFAMLSAIVTSRINSYETEKKLGEITWIATASTRLITSKYTYSGCSLPEYISNNQEDISSIFSIFSARDDKTAFVISDGNGKVLYSYMSDGSTIQKTLIPSDVISQLAVAEEYTEIGNMRGVFDGKYIVIGYPLFDRGNSDEVIGCMFAAISSASQDALINDMMQTIIVSSLWVMVAALIAVYFISDRIVYPLKKMSIAARSFAKGQFDARIEVTGNDEISELAGAFNQMAESLAQLEKMRHSFIANVSHDLRTPMTTIAGFIEGILDGTIPPDKQNYYLDIVHTEVKRLSRLVTELLDISKMQAGERKFNFEPFDICEMVRLVIISFEQKLDSKKLDVEFECESDSIMATGDKDAIYQIVYNLIDNAIKFSRDGGKLRVTIKESDHKVVTSVYNEGAGISPEDLPYVFERFYKSDKSRGLDKTGSGLGLYIARTIIEAHGQQIWVDSREGEYCEFTFTLKSAGRAPRQVNLKSDEI